MPEKWTKPSTTSTNSWLSPPRKQPTNFTTCVANAYRKLGDWQMALNNYLEAIALNPESPAVQARAMAMDILEFYNKDMYNQ